MDLNAEALRFKLQYDREPNPGWANFVMDWERPPSWRIGKTRKWLQRHYHIWFMEHELGFNDNICMPRWLYRWVHHNDGY